VSLTRRSLLVLLLVLGLVAASAVVIAVKPTVLGLDLEGGVEVILQGKPTATAPVDDASIGRAIEIIRNRVDRFGVSEPEIQRQGDDQITVSLPGAKDPERVVEDLIKPAQLFFYDYQANLLPPEEPTLYAAATRAAGLKPEKVSNPDAQPSYYLFRRNPAHTLVAGPEVDLTSLKGNATQIRQACGTGPFPGTCKLVKVPKGLVIFKNVQQLPGSSRVSRTVWDIMKDNPGLRGKDITSARQQLDQSTFGNNEPIVTMQFTDQGRKLFQQVTKDLATRGALRQQLQSFAIVLDGVIISNPTVDYKQYPQGIDGSNGAQIQGNFTVSSARTLADQLNSGAIPIKLEPISLRQVSATLGKQSLREGLIAGIVGLALVMIFLVAYYRILGLVADAALLIYGLLFYAVVKLVPITMTLPGIAGMILTIGVAADANVVIFERIREEARAGRSPRAAVLNGYKRGISAIIDANVVTLGTAAILFLFATAGVKGFAFTLFVGVILSLFTAVLATRAVFGLLADTKLFRNERLMGLHQREIKWKFDFVGYWKLWLAISFIPLALGAFWIGIKGLNLGLDFESGTRISVTYGGAQPSENSVRAAVDKAGFTDAKVQATTETLNGRTVHGFQIQTKTLSPGEQRAVTRQLDTLDGGVTVNEVTTVGPTFGRQIIRNAIYAILISFALIIVYLSIRFEYKLAVPALISVIHDVWLALSIYSIVGREVTSATVAAILTILGYSLYDVVIVFDRIRENVPLMRSATYRQIVNRSVHETLTRSIITSVTTLLPVAVLYLFGGDTLKDFAFALLVGILSGGLSSIAIAAPLVALWKEREPQARKRVARQAKKRRRLENIDADVVDVTVLERAEAALDARIAEEERVDEYHGLTLEPEEEPEREPEPEPERRGRATTPRADNGGAPEAVAPAAPAEAPPNGPAPEPEEVPAAEEPAAEEPVGDEPAGEEPAPSKPAAPAPQRPERVRRHRQVQRKKGGRR
jgi:SecD/SecF fusion protein